MSHMFLKNDQGFTLIELMVSITIISIVTTTVFSLYTIAIKAYDRDYSRISLQQNARQAFIRLTNSLRLAKKCDVLSSSKVSITTPKGNIVYYYLEDGVLYREKNGGKNPVSEIEDLNIRISDDGSIELRLTAQEKGQMIEMFTSITPYGSYF